MLARAGRRKLRRDAFRSPTQLAEQLTLPWLCPAQMRWAASVRHSTATPYDARRPRHAVPSPRHETRSLATAADVQPSQMPMTFDPILPPWASSSHMQPAGLSRLEPWDPSAPLILRQSVSLPSTPSRFGIGGDPIELFQNLHACLRVGRMERATAIIQRLTTMYDPAAHEVVEAHNAYLQTVLERAQQNPTPTAMAEMEEWYDAHMARRGIAPNAGTFITLLRASMTLLEGHERHRALRKYLIMAEESGEDVMDAINASEDFDDHEWDALIRAQPERFREPPAMDEPGEIHISTPAGHAALIEHGLLRDPAHTVRAIEQKGQGLIALKDSLLVFESNARVPYPQEMEGNKEEKDRAHAYLRQLRLERDATEAAVARWRTEDEKLKEIGIHGILKSKSIQSFMWQWYSALLPRVKKEFARTKEVLSAPSNDNRSDERHTYGPYLEMCNPEKLAALTIGRIVQGCAKSLKADVQALKVSVLCSALGEDFWQDANSEALQKHLARQKKQRKDARRTLLNSLARETKDTRPASKPVIEPMPLTDAFMKKDIPQSIKTRLGAMMLEHFLHAATVTVTAEDPKTGKQLTSTRAAFHHNIGFAHGKKTGWIIPHQDILAKLSSESVGGIASLKLPMIFEPKPWASFDEGGYYSSLGSVVRTRYGDSAQRAYAQSAIANGDMDKILKGLDTLGKVPWQINKELFQVMAQAWNAGEGIGAMVAAQTHVEPPTEPPEDAPATERKLWLQRLKNHQNTMSGYHSQRCFQNFQLEIARAYVHEPKIYFPHSLDFRGRAYPIPPLLNHMGSDFARGLLRFANGKELGSVGLQWLKVHLANLYGFDKASLRDREQFTMDNIHEIYDSATNPLDGRRWWTKAEDPWQCLACCMELKNALESPDPTRFLSHLPIHQDGTCNGLQHYAALGGDRAGASQVNLEPSDRPQDIYTGVAELVREMVAEDAASGHAAAKLMKDKITRKVVKRTVMTNVYGVTFIGAKTQVESELRDIFPKFEAVDGVSSLAVVAMYIASKIFAALGKIFNGAQDIQHWLGECGDRITSSIPPEQIQFIREHIEGKPVLYFENKYKSKKKKSPNAKKKIVEDAETFKTSIIWTTPLKMPVVQPYRKQKIQVIKTHLQEIIIPRRNYANAVDKRKQLQAFPPNFIHSLDATHMILSALKCDELGLDFAAVHDSFWTHAADIPNLNVVLRDAFVRMHSEDIMGRLHAEFNARYAGSMYKSKIHATSSVAKVILAWRTKQNGGKIPPNRLHATFTELALESKRQELLNSEDPKLRKQGQQMVTPTSIWQANADPKDFASIRLALIGEVKPPEAAIGAVGTEVEDLNELDAETEGDDAELKTDAVTKAKQRNIVTVWLPLEFPPVPKKGDWDISRLHQSKYFFS